MCVYLLVVMYEGVYVCACVYVCMYLDMYVCVYVCTVCVCLRVRTRVYLFLLYSFHLFYSIYSPLFKQNAVKEVHFSGNMHKEVGNNVGRC